jgi:hypothetical protein
LQIKGINLAYKKNPAANFPLKTKIFPDKFPLSEWFDAQSKHRFTGLEA